MSNACENFVIMDGNKRTLDKQATEITFGKQNIISISKSVAAFLTIFIIGCIVATGLVVYYFSSCPLNYNLGPQEHVSSNHDAISSSDSERSTATEINNNYITTSDYMVDQFNTFATTQKVKTENEVDLRLPKSVVPISYKIHLVPFIEEGNFTFHGNVTILVNVTEVTNTIVLHSDDLDIDQVDAFLDNTKLNIKEITNNSRKHFFIIEFVEPLEIAKQYYLIIVYKGALTDLLVGFYRSSYKEKNATRWIAVTQFQTTDARKAFPCFDEPALKARFQLNIARLKNMTAISNMPKIATTNSTLLPENYVWDHFQESVPMSTYLLAFTVCDFVSISSESFSVWARKGAISQSKFSLEIGPKVLKFYEDFFGIEYPLPKMDLIAIPDFSAGAMENWGLITFRESLLLYQEGVSAKDNLQKIAQVVAHELAHQWFGNLVTPVWWSDLWLNEGFATFAEYLGVDAVEPSWKMQDQFIIREVQSAMFLDALKTSHQISVEVNDPDEISNIFDRISYSKGAAVIRMMQNFLGDDVFKRGLSKYLQERMYGNAEQDDLWNTLTQQSHEDKALNESMSVKEIMDTWTLQRGFPVISAQRSYENNTITFSQEIFSLQRHDDTLWWVPLTIGDPHGTVYKKWMPQQIKLTVEDINVDSGDWILINLNFTGYFRVNYDEQNWKLITDQLLKPQGHIKIDPKNRAQIIDDAFSLISAGYLNYDVALNISKYLVQEREYLPWEAVSIHLDYLEEMFERTAHFDKYKAYVLKLMETFYKEIGSQESSDDHLLLLYSRTQILGRACRLGFRDCVIKAVHEFQNWRNSVDPDRFNRIYPNLRTVIYCTAIRVGGQEEWDFLWQRYLIANVGNEREILMEALGCSREMWILSRYLEWAITPNSGIRKQDSPLVFASVANNPVGQDLAYKFVKTKWDQMRQYLGPSSMSLSNILRSSAIFNTKEEIDDFKLFADNKGEKLGIAKKAAQQIIEQGEANVKWMEQNFENIVNWLETVEF